MVGDRKRGLAPRGHTAACAVVTACLCASPLSAQIVRGTARVEGNTQGSAQTTIVLVDTLGALVAGTTTGESGVYLIRAPHAGTYRVRARRIGFAPDSSGVIVIAPGATVAFDPTMKRLQTQLAEVRVQETRRCVIAPEAGANALRLWQEAQNALSGAAVNTVSGTNSFVLNRFQRQLDPQAKRVIKATRWQVPARGSETYASIPADSLATEGFVKMVGSDAIYYAPDARTLLSDAFARTHCLRPVAGVTGSDSVGLAFEPIGRDTRTDVAGTLWLARSTGKLKYLAFQYVDSAARGGSSDPRVPPAKGRVDYRELPSGAWIISSWAIRVPLMHFSTAHNVTTDFGTSFRAEAIPSVTGWWEFGGDVADMTTEQSDKQAGVFALNSGSLRGALLDSVALQGVSGIEASVQTTDLKKIVARTTTDSSGRFAFDSLLAGDYVLRFAAPRLDTLDVTVPSTPFSVVTGNELTLTTTMPASGISRACPAEQPDQRILHGVIRDSVSGLPLPSVSVRVTWLARTQIHAGGRGLMWQTSGREATTDAAGRYFLCGLPTERILTVAMADAGHRMTKIQIPERSDAVVLRNVGLSGEALANGDLLGSISGTARDPAGSGIAAAEVSLLDNSGRRAYTDSTGTFRFDSVASGFHVLRVRRLGLAPSTVPVRVATHGVTSVHVVMATVAAILQPVEVRAPSGEVLRLPKDVAHRLTAGQGYYILAGDARLRTSYSTSDIFRHIQGVTVKGDLAVSTRGINSILADPCPLGMPLYVNGSAMGDNTLDVVAPSEIAAIEIYPTTASMPPSMHPSPCGAIMIWTK